MRDKPRGRWGANRTTGAAGHGRKGTGGRAMGQEGGGRRRRRRGAPVAAAPAVVWAAAPGVAATGQRSGAGRGGERGAPSADGAVGGVGAYGAPPTSPADSIAGAINHLPAGDGGGEGGGRRTKENRWGHRRGAAANPVADHRGRKKRLDGAEGAAGDSQKGRRQGEVRGGKGRGTLRRRGAAASGKENRGEGGSKECRRERGVQDTERKADRRGKVSKVHEGWDRGTEGCSGRVGQPVAGGKAQGKVYGGTGVPGKGGRRVVGRCHPTGSPKNVPCAHAGVPPPHRCTRLHCRRHPCSSTRRPSGRRGGRREGRGRSSGGHGVGYGEARQFDGFH